MENFDIPHLGSVEIDTGGHWPSITIRLADDYNGDLRMWEQNNQLAPGIYFYGGDINAIGDPHFTRFMEVMTHWDHDGDGVFDCDHIIERLDEVFVMFDVNAVPFKRPDSGVYTRWLMRHMPREPERHILYNYGELRPHFKRWHYAGAIPMLVLFIGLVYAQTTVAPFMRLSPLSGFAWTADRIGFLWAWLILIAAILLLRVIRKSEPADGKGRSFGSHTYGFFNKAAVYEEQAFREGAENWSREERIKSHLIFGAIHQTNLFYPLATILPLAVGGAFLTKVYLHSLEKTGFRRTAVLEASLAHRVYNRMALISIALFVSVMVSSLIIGSLLALVTFIGTYIAIGTAARALRHIRHNNTPQELVRAK